MSSTNTQGQVRRTGCVKWFNNKVGWGFLSVVGDSSDAPQDVFVHHSAIQVDKVQYKYLVQGEYVEFGLVASSEKGHEVQASGVSGIKGGKLMCETRREFRMARAQFKTTPATEELKPRSKQVPSNRKPRPSAPPANDNTWTYVGKASATSAPASTPAPAKRAPKKAQASKK